MTITLDLVNKIPIYIFRSDDELSFYCIDGNRYQFYHDQNCCETVEIEDINGDLGNLLYTPILKAGERTSEKGDLTASEPLHDYDESYTWTFYTFATKNGYVDVRWYGSSNGYIFRYLFQHISQDVTWGYSIHTDSPPAQLTRPNLGHPNHACLGCHIIGLAKVPIQPHIS